MFFVEKKFSTFSINVTTKPEFDLASKNDKFFSTNILKRKQKKICKALFIQCK